MIIRIASLIECRYKKTDATGGTQTVNMPACEVGECVVETETCWCGGIRSAENRKMMVSSRPDEFLGVTKLR